MMNRNVWIRLALSTALARRTHARVRRACSRRRGPPEECHRRLESDRARIDSDVIRYGDSSRQVGRDVAKMDKSRQWCRDHQRIGITTGSILAST